MDGMNCDQTHLVVVSSLTGNTRTFLEFLDTHSSSNLLVSEDFSDDLDRYSHICFGTYTWSNGKLPKKMKDFLLANHHKLKGKKIFIFGSGNSIYPNFCGAVDGILRICSDSQSNIIGSHKFEQRFIESEMTDEEKRQLIMTIKTWSA